MGGIACGRAAIAGVVMAAAPMAAAQEDGGFEAERRPRSVDLDATYNVEGLLVPKEEIHTLLPRDAIPSLTDPAMEVASEIDWLEDEDRMTVVELGGEVVAVPLRVLNFHEIANMEVGGEPIAVAYCPLCDSVTVFSRRVGEDGPVLEFGVSGALFNSNVLMYDRSDRALWSQLDMRAISGPMAGTRLDHLPVRLETFGRFRAAHPGSEVVSIKTGHDRPYAQRDPYKRFFEDPDMLIGRPREHGDALPKKTLGVGILAGERTWFVPVDAIGEGMMVETPAGEVRLRTGPAGVEVVTAPDSVFTAQAFYYAWSAFHPSTEVVGRPSGDPDDG